MKYTKHLNESSPLLLLCCLEKCHSKLHIKMQKHATMPLRSTGGETTILVSHQQQLGGSLLAAKHPHRGTATPFREPPCERYLSAAVCIEAFQQASKQIHRIMCFPHGRIISSAFIPADIPTKGENGYICGIQI